MTIYYTEKNGTANHPQVSQMTVDSIVVGKRKVCELIANSVKQHLNHAKTPYLLALDGYLGVEWKKIVKELKKILTDKQIESKIISIFSYFKKPSEIDKIIQPHLECDPHFGFVFDGHLEQFFDTKKLAQIQEKLHGFRKTYSKPQNLVIICYGIGSTIQQLKEYFNKIVYFDITREELFNRSEMMSIACLGSKGGQYPVHKNLKRFCYIDSMVLDKHKKKVLQEMDWYVDSNNTDELKIVPRTSYEEVLSNMAKAPIIMKQLYYPAVWGGNWQKKIKKLPNSMPNSGQGSIVPNENSVEISLGKFIVDIPFQNLMWLKPKSILGSYANQITNGRFPLSYYYDDEIVGGHMAIQVHPDDNYIKQKFNESTRQDESYYILQTGLGAKTYLGLREDASINEFHKESLESDKQKKPYDYEKYVDSINTKPGDFLLIPAGTVHASGKNQVVIEIDWVNTIYTPGYTFHIYDYIRHDLDGTYRAMHIEHAFNVLKEDRRTQWVQKNLKQKPELLKKGHDWAEYVIGIRDDMLFKVHRLEFQKRINDKTDPELTFHVLTLVEGERILIQSWDNPEIKCRLEFPDTLIVPASLGQYTIYNLGEKPCKVVKAMVKS